MSTGLWILLLVALMFLMHRFAGGMGGCCGGHGHSGHGGGSGHGQDTESQGQPHSHEHPNPAHMGARETVQDPVCGMYVVPGEAVRREIGGRIYYFCSEHCAHEFERNHRAGA